MELGDVTGGRWLVGARVHSLLLCHPSPGKIQCIVAPRFDEKYPLVVPHQVWHLHSGWAPLQVFAKPTLVDLACANKEDRSVFG